MRHTRTHMGPDNDRQRCTRRLVGADLSHIHTYEAPHTSPTAYSYVVRTTAVDGRGGACFDAQNHQNVCRETLPTKPAARFTTRPWSIGPMVDPSTVERLVGRPGSPSTATRQPVRLEVLTKAWMRDLIVFRVVGAWFFRNCFFEFDEFSCRCHLTC